MVQEAFGVEQVSRQEIKVNPVSVNHFTWLTSATYHNKDLYPYYREFCQKYSDGYKQEDKAWLNSVFAGAVPTTIYPVVSRVCAEQELLSEAIAERDLEKIFLAFSNDPLVTCGLDDARKLFIEMCNNTKTYLTMYRFDCFR